MGAYDIKLPPFLTADVDLEDTEPRRGWWGGNTFRYFIVLKFGGREIGRWEWQTERPIEAREEPDEDDLVIFVSEKLSEVMFPKKENE